MGGKCLTIPKSPEPKPLQFPKFTYLSTESCVSFKFISPDKITSKRIVMESERLPTDALVCKVAPNYFFITGGLNLNNWDRVDKCFELRFSNTPESGKIEPKEHCPHIPYGGTLYLHESQIYLVGSAQEISENLDKEVDANFIMEPFREYGPQPLLLQKHLESLLILRYSITRNRWKPIQHTPEMLKEDNEIVSDRFPDMILLPGTCKVDSKIFFFGGQLEKEVESTNAKGEKIMVKALDKLNQNVYTLDLNSRKVKKLETFFEGIFAEPKCVYLSEGEIIILGGYNEELEYNKKIYFYQIGDEKVVEEKQVLDGNNKFHDNYPPVGKYNFAMFFGYPNVLVINHQANTKETIRITAIVE